MTGIILQAAGSGGAMTGNLILIGGIILIFYFFMIRPQQKKQKEQKRFLEGLKKGDKVVTLGGIHGKIMAIEGEIVQLEVDRGTKLTIEKSSVSLDASKKFMENKK